MPTAENVARQLWADAEPLFHDSAAKLVACHLCETHGAKRDLVCRWRLRGELLVRIFRGAANDVAAPHDAENEQLFGVAASKLGHGHNYRARVTFQDWRRPMTLAGDARDS